MESAIAVRRKLHPSDQWKFKTAVSYKKLKWALFFLFRPTIFGQTRIERVTEVAPFRFYTILARQF
jgi:hypothetical protein